MRENLRTAGVRLQQVSLAAAVLMVAVVCIDTGMHLAAFDAKDGAVQLIYRLPVLTYLYALLCLWVFARRLVANGGRRTELAPLLQHVGIAFVAGSVLTVLIVPLAVRVIADMGSFLAFDPAGLASLAAGICLILVGRLIDDAAAMRQELDEFV